MSDKRAGQLIARIEVHIGCWKQFNCFVNLARAKRFGPEDESHFLELKKIIGRRPPRFSVARCRCAVWAKWAETTCAISKMPGRRYTSAGIPFWGGSQSAAATGRAPFSAGEDNFAARVSTVRHARVGRA